MAENTDSVFSRELNLLKQCDALVLWFILAAGWLECTTTLFLIDLLAEIQHSA